MPVTSNRPSRSAYDQAEPLFRRALAIREAALGPDHPNTGKSLGNLAGVLQAKGDYDAAESLFRRALAINEAALEPDHPDTGTSMGNLARLLEAKGDYDAAEPLFRRAQAIDEASPLRPRVDDGAQAARKVISVTFVGRDGVFHDDLHCIKRYSLSDDVVLDHRFVDATTFDEKTGKPKISFEKISDVVPLSKPRRSREYAVTRAARLAKFRLKL